MGVWDLMFNKDEVYLSILIYCIGGLGTSWLLLGGFNTSWWLSWWCLVPLCGAAILNGLHYAASSMAWISMLSTSAGNYSWYLCVTTIVTAFLYAVFYGYALYVVADFCTTPNLDTVNLTSGGVETKEVSGWNYLQATVAFVQVPLHLAVCYYQYDYMSVLDSGKTKYDSDTDGYSSC